MRVFVALSVPVMTVLAIGAAMAAAGRPSTTPTGNFSVLDVDVSSPEPSLRGRPRGVELTYDSFIGNRLTGQRPPNAADLKIHFQSGFVFNGELFPSCPLTAAAPTDCPARSRIGRGRAEIDAGPAVPTPFGVRIDAYNGAARNGNQTVLIFAQQGTEVLGKLLGELRSEPRGPYGDVLDFDPVVSPPETPPFTISQLSLRTIDRSRFRRQRGRRVRRHLIEAPTVCRGSWAFAQVNPLENGETLTATDRDSCAAER
jgi:hypothetical protein